MPKFSLNRRASIFWSRRDARMGVIVTNVGAVMINSPASDMKACAIYGNRHTTHSDHQAITGHGDGDYAKGDNVLIARPAGAGVCIRKTHGLCNRVAQITIRRHGNHLLPIAWWVVDLYRTARLGVWDRAGQVWAAIRIITQPQAAGACRSIHRAGFNCALPTHPFDAAFKIGNARR
jgi:hypothetical protein